MKSVPVEMGGKFVVGSANQEKTPQGNAEERYERAAKPAGSAGVRSVHRQCGTNVAMIGCSDAFTSLLDTLESIAGRECCVMITGETGTGKEMAARKIHLLSRRADKPFVPVDCTTLTGQLFESQLFGHVKGAFTGAIHDTLGFFRAADGGTIFLDEISEIPLELQAKLLRVLQEGTVTPVGSTRSYPIDVRVLCATNRQLRTMVEKNEFRADLYYRINVINLEIPPLRQRPEDILPLADYFLQNLADFYAEPPKKLSSHAQHLLLNYSWPGNVRQLANAMERAYVLSRSQIIEPSALPSEILMSAYTAGPGRVLPTLDAAQEQLITEALRITNGRKVAAARMLGIDRRRLNRIIEKLHIQVPKSND
ncbi:MAG TPA: sigma-54 dependent transcriptional regulator [Anaerohalosphaeraceae bacterium]|nr:sigma-54 dependent transcriptional regulator [Anaerohalosphaeraceae bacterium]HOM76991.1 sigma-54 dependent transcriptional regulator [Anaerohalosphaeraceae bacterium]HPC63759.1 sigma-54 dependent transcriptional regulator [Anaerohalosphaeraceae bacterium]HPO69061.1 sigma-54 dependent transcriptional regulator [Anaerohalosphaeraceae bacterium]HRS71952.1 sigma-54 dependent transcriptional regulator [Anaerohalosphaeraceae bacterium]